MSYHVAGRRSRNSAPALADDSRPDLAETIGVVSVALIGTGLAVLLMTACLVGLVMVVVEVAR